MTKRPVRKLPAMRQPTHNHYLFNLPKAPRLKIPPVITVAVIALLVSGLMSYLTGNPWYFLGVAGLIAGIWFLSHQIKESGAARRAQLKEQERKDEADKRERQRKARQEEAKRERQEAQAERKRQKQEKEERTAAYYEQEQAHHQSRVAQGETDRLPPLAPRPKPTTKRPQTK